MYNDTAQRTGTTNPLTLDIIRKIAIVSVEMEKALNNKDIKGAAEYSKMHKSLIDAAGLDEMIEVSESDSISGLSELCDYIEGLGFQPKFYDGVKRDIVDATIDDIQKWYINFFKNQTGVAQAYENIEETYRNKLEQEASGEAFDETSLEDLIDSVKNGKGSGFEKTEDAETDDTSFLNDMSNFKDEK